MYLFVAVSISMYKSYMYEQVFAKKNTMCLYFLLFSNCMHAIRLLPTFLLLIIENRYSKYTLLSILLGK